MCPSLDQICEVWRSSLFTQKRVPSKDHITLEIMFSLRSVLWYWILSMVLFFCQGMTWVCYKNTSYAPILRCSLAAPTLRYPKDLTSHQSGMRWHVVHFLCRYRYRSVYQFSKLFSEIVLVSLICSSVVFFAKESRLQCCANRTSTHISNMFFRKMPCGWF